MLGEVGAFFRDRMVKSSSDIFVTVRGRVDTLSEGNYLELTDMKKDDHLGDQVAEVQAAFKEFREQVGLDAAALRSKLTGTVQRVEGFDCLPVDYGRNGKAAACKFWGRGRCKLGNGCKLRHEGTDDFEEVSQSWRRLVLVEGSRGTSSRSASADC